MRHPIPRSLLLLLVACGQAMADFHVSPTAKPGGNGSPAAPFSELEQARDAIRAAKPSQPVTVWLHGGNYQRTNVFLLGTVDSGSPTAPVTYRGVAGEVPRLVGGRVITGFEPVKDAAALSRFSPAAQKSVRVADLRAQGVSQFGTMKSRGFARPIVPAHAELFFNGKPMTLAQWPNEGEWTKIAGFPEKTGHNDDHGGTIGALPNGFQYTGDRPKTWKSLTNIWVHGYWAWDWANSYESVESIDLEKRLVLTRPPHGNYGFRVGHRFQFLNVMEELDQPGEWFLDVEKGLLYFWPPSDLQGALVSMSLIESPLIRVEASNVTIQGLSLEAGRGNGLEIQGGENVRIISCAIKLMGNYGATITGGKNHRIEACDITDTGDGGVIVSGGDRATLTPSGHVVENCHFARQARWSRCYAPAVLMDGVGQRISHNLIHDHPHCGILFTGNDHLIEFNEIHRVALETGDVGAIYTGRDYTYRGNRIRNNFIHHTGGVGMGSMGVYMDDCVSGTEIYGNVFQKVQRAAFLGGGRDHQVVNNIFIDCTPAVQLDGRGLDKTPVWHNMVYDFMKQGLQAMPAALYRERYPAIRELDGLFGQTNGIPPAHNKVADNISVGGQWLETGWHAAKDIIEMGTNHVGGDPGFVDAANGDFTLKPGSAALKAGVQPVPFKQMGLRKDQARLAVERLSQP